LNSLHPDLVLITGDICDKAKCVTWLAEVLSPIEARHGKFFILGNHDKRLTDIPALRAAIEATGFADVDAVDWSRGFGRKSFVGKTA
jgi:predicted MPP superfamily phosphohydrolase